MLGAGNAGLQIFHHRHLLKGNVPKDGLKPDLESSGLIHPPLNLFAEALHAADGALIHVVGKLGQEFLGL